jgi:ethanolamine ammonia-lyase small subunit
MMSDIITRDSWEELRKLTAARIALGRSGSSIPLRHELDFRLAHAHARDAVHSVMDIRAITAALQSTGLPVIELMSQADTRERYLQRPDFGRFPNEASIALLKSVAIPNDVSLIVADGLSATAINNHAPSLILQLVNGLRASGLVPGPISVVRHARVAIGDHIGQALLSKLTVMLIGERPGLSAADSMSAYLTYNPVPGTTDEARNCVSNIRPKGLALSLAAQKIMYLVEAAFTRRLSGVQLKDDSVISEETVIKRISE